MGAWGHRIFQSDATWAFLQNEVDRLITLVEGELANPSPDGFVDNPTFAAIACLHSYLLHIPESRGEITKKTILAWKDKVTQWMDYSFNEVLNASETEEEEARAEIIGKLESMIHLAEDQGF